MERITTPDHTPITLHTTGTGPGIVIVHGGGVTIDMYRRLATRLADRYTVHLYNRRGRADAVPRPRPYRLEDDIADLGAVLAHTGSSNVIGHSIGGFIALQAALSLPIERLALCDAAVSVDGAFDMEWFDSAQAAAESGDIARSLAITSAGLNPQMAASKLPLWALIPILRGFMRTPIGASMAELLPTTLEEAAASRDHEGPPEQYAGVTAEVLLLRGLDGPPYYEDIHAALAAAIPRARTLALPRSGHDALNRAHPRLVEPLAEFFGAPANAPTARRHD